MGKTTQTFISDKGLRKVLFFVFILLVQGSVWAQGSLSVQVLDSENHPVEFANLRLFKVPDSTVASGAYSDEQGKITIDNIKYGNYYALISFFGFEEYKVESLSFSKEKSKVNLGKIHLQVIKSQEFDEVVVMGKEKTIMETSIDKKVYNVDEDMTSMGGDAADILNNIPSVEVDNEGNISLRGNGSVKILIDGRESAMTSGDNPLDGIPASAIERIEVVTNPSAKYNPEGTAGIINIILKKTKIRGFNGNVQLTVGIRDLYTGNVGFNYRNEYVNVFANYSFSYTENSRDNFTKRWSKVGGNELFLDQDNNGTGLNRSHTANVGADFFIKENQVIGVSISGTTGVRNEWDDFYNVQVLNDNLEFFWYRWGTNPFDRRSISVNTNYKLDFKDGGNLMIAASGSARGFDSEGSFTENYFYADSTSMPNPYRFQEQIRKGHNANYNLNADFTKPINDKMKYETGLEVRLRRMGQFSNLERFDTISKTIVPDSSGINQLKHSENIFSAYGIFAHDVTRLFKYQIGVRLEQANINPHFITSNESFAFKYFTVYPSVHLAIGDEKMGTFGISYSRRVNRPSPWQMNPFPTITDPLNIRTGNPGLRPEFINSAEIGYEKMWKKGSISSTAYFKHIENKIQRITEFREDGVSVSTFANIDPAMDYGLEVIGTFNPFPWWRNMISFNVYETQVSATYNNVQFKNRGITWDMKLNITFSLLKNRMNIQLNGGYNAPRPTVQGTFQHTPGIGAGITYAFLDDKSLVLGFRVSDIFNQQGFFMEVNEENRVQKTQFKWTTRRFLFTLSYKFGNLKLKEDKKKRDFEGGGDMEF